MKKFNTTISCFVIGLAFAIIAGRIGFRPRFLWYVVVVAGLTALHMAWFTLVPKFSLKLAGGDLQRQRRLLRWVVNTPSPRGSKTLARYMLGHNDQVARRYPEAESQYRSILSELPETHAHGQISGLRSQIQQNLADTLEALGRFDEAAFERQRATESLQTSKENVVSLEARGKLLERENRHQEAYEAYERALALAPERSKAVRSVLMMRLVLSSFNSGRPADTLRWAEAVVAADEHGTHAGSARRMAAIACNNLGRLADAEKHARLAVELAPNVGERAKAMGILCEYIMRRGDLDEAERLAGEAEALQPGKERIPSSILASIAKERGHLEEAVELYENNKLISIGHIPAGNRRANAVTDKELAVLYARLGHQDQALALLRSAETELANDPKLKVTLAAAAAVVHAACGQADEARSSIESAEQGLEALPDVIATRKAALYLLGDAALQLDDPKRAESFLRNYLDLNPDPLYLSYAHYHLAECRRRLGDVVGARIQDRKAASTNFGTLYERLARERLAAEDIFA